jgi:hypothetical protein
MAMPSNEVSSLRKISGVGGSCSTSGVCHQSDHQTVVLSYQDVQAFIHSNGGIDKIGSQLAHATRTGLGAYPIKLRQASTLPKRQCVVRVTIFNGANSGMLTCRTRWSPLAHAVARIGVSRLPSIHDTVPGAGTTCSHARGERSKQHVCLAACYRRPAGRRRRTPNAATAHFATPATHQARRRCSCRRFALREDENHAKTPRARRGEPETLAASTALANGTPLDLAVRTGTTPGAFAAPTGHRTPGANARRHAS